MVTVRTERQENDLAKGQGHKAEFGFECLRVKEGDARNHSQLSLLPTEGHNRGIGIRTGFYCDCHALKKRESLGQGLRAPVGKVSALSSALKASVLKRASV